jgi:hypothetical protein
LPVVQEQPRFHQATVVSEDGVFVYRQGLKVFGCIQCKEWNPHLQGFATHLMRKHKRRRVLRSCVSPDGVCPACQINFSTGAQVLQHPVDLSPTCGLTIVLRETRYDDELVGIWDQKDRVARALLWAQGGRVTRADGPGEWLGRPAGALFATRGHPTTTRFEHLAEALTRATEVPVAQAPPVSVLTAGFPFLPLMSALCGFPENVRQQLRPQRTVSRYLPLRHCTVSAVAWASACKTFSCETLLAGAIAIQRH